MKEPFPPLKVGKSYVSHDAYCILFDNFQASPMLNYPISPMATNYQYLEQVEGRAERKHIFKRRELCLSVWEYMGIEK